MIYRLEACCLIILIVIAFLFFTVKRKPSKMHKYFAHLVVWSIIYMTFDITTVYTVNHLNTVPKWMNRGAHQVFLISLLVIFYLVYQYITGMLEEENDIQMKNTIAKIIPLVLSCLGTLFLPLYYVETEIVNYSYGPAVYVIYVSVIIYAGVAIFNIVKYWNRISVKKKKAISIAMFGELGVSIYQILVPTSLISGIGVTLLVIGLFLTVESPDTALIELLEDEKKKAEASRQEAELANAAKGRFLAQMSHEIRTPINAVLGMDEMILRESNEKIIKGYAQDIKQAGNNLLSIINEILDLSKIESGKMEIIEVDYEFATLLQDIINMLSAKINDKGLEFRISVSESIPYTLHGDDIRVRQVLVNLLNNAVKYTENGYVALTITQERKEDRVVLEFQIQDSGIGIKEEDIEKLYSEFQRIEEQRNRKIEGTGLGMNITIQLLEMMGSRLEVSSVYGQGSEFSFELEQGVVNDKAIGDYKQLLAKREDIKEYKALFKAPKAKILLVDDNDMNRKVFCSLLKKTEIQIVQGAGGRECIAHAKEEKFDIIFLDHMMPDLDGIETLKILKSEEEHLNHDTPIVILTANAVVGAREEYLSLGFDEFLSKPVFPESLDAILLQLLDKNLVEEYIEEDLKTETTEGVATSVGKNTEVFPEVDGLDYAYAKQHFSDLETMFDAIHFFYLSLEKEADKLQDFAKNLETEDAVKAYRIQVHSMKNAAATIGIIPLAGMAKVLEDAAREQTLGVIHAMHDIFIEKWLSYKEKLQSFIAQITEKDGTEHVLIETLTEEIATLLEMLKHAAEELDMDVLDCVMKQLNQFQYAQSLAAVMEELRLAVLEFDVEHIPGMVEKICQSFKK